MVDSLIAISGLQLAQFFGTGVAPVPLGTAHPGNAPYQMFQAADRPFILAAGNDTLWAKVCDILEDSCLRNDARFVTQHLRVANQTELANKLNSHFSQDTAASWIHRFSSQGIPVGPVNTLADVAESPHVSERGIIGAFTLECGCIGRGPVFPVQTSYITTTSAQSYGSVPKLGEHTTEVLREWSQLG
jgi:crotonobetainyl-CoA:carnitine CoA-transferase CaiB-like acyl-CoA transferase